MQISDIISGVQVMYTAWEAYAAVAVITGLFLVAERWWHHPTHSRWLNGYTLVGGLVTLIGFFLYAVTMLHEMDLKNGGHSIALLAGLIASAILGLTTAHYMTRRPKPAIA